MAKLQKKLGDIVAKEFLQQNNIGNTQNAEQAYNTSSDNIKQIVINTNNDENEFITQKSEDVQNTQLTQIIQSDDVIHKADNVYDTYFNEFTHDIKIEHNQNTQIDHNTSNDTRRFSLIISTSLNKEIKTIASIKQISVIKAILLAVEKYISENKETIEKYNNFINGLSSNS